MRKIHIIYLQPVADRNELVLYTARFKNRNEARLIMFLQGVLPKHNIVAHAEVRPIIFLVNTWWPQLGVIREQFGKLTFWTILKYMVLPVKRFFRGAILQNYKQYGHYDKISKRVYPEPEKIARSK